VSSAAIICVLVVLTNDWLNLSLTSLSFLALYGKATTNSVKAYKQAYRSINIKNSFHEVCLCNRIISPCPL
jgi:hypothetical protein